MPVLEKPEQSSSFFFTAFSQGWMGSGFSHTIPHPSHSAWSAGLWSHKHIMKCYQVPGPLGNNFCYPLGNITSLYPRNDPENRYGRDCQHSQTLGPLPALAPKTEASISAKSEVMKTWGFASFMPSVTAIRLCHCNMKAAIDNKEANEYICIPIKLYLQKPTGS